METASRLAVMLFVLAAHNYGQATSIRTEDFPNTPALSNRLAHFDLTDATLIDGLSKLSNEPINGLHLGIEEIIQDKFPEHTDRSVRFSLSLHDATVRDIIDTLCKSDRRYTWSVEGSSVNVYPRETVRYSAY